MRGDEVGDVLYLPNKRIEGDNHWWVRNTYIGYTGTWSGGMGVR